MGLDLDKKVSSGGDHMIPTNGKRDKIWLTNVATERAGEVRSLEKKEGGKCLGTKKKKTCGPEGKALLPKKRRIKES